MRKRERGKEKGNLKRETESHLIAAQNNAIWISYIKSRMVKTQQYCRCSLCGDRGEGINHIISKCSKLATNSIILETVIH